MSGYTLGKCKLCLKDTALKDGICGDCALNPPSNPDILNQIFNIFNGGENVSANKNKK